MLRAATLTLGLGFSAGLAGCFFLPYRPSDDPEPYGDYPHGSDPDRDDDGDGYSEVDGDCDDGDVAGRA